MKAHLLPTRPTFAPVAFLRPSWPNVRAALSTAPGPKCPTTCLAAPTVRLRERVGRTLPRQQIEDVWRVRRPWRTGVVFPGTFAPDKKETRLKLGPRLKPPAVDEPMESTPSKVEPVKGRRIGEPKVERAFSQ